MSYEQILVTQDQGVLKIALNQPKKLNALSGKMMEELREAMQGAAGDPSVRCILLTGEGRGFSAGADLTDGSIQFVPGQPIDYSATLDSRYHPLVTLMREMPKPIVVAVNGIAAGAGCSIALAGDVVMAARSAKFIQVFVRISLIPDAGSTWTVPRLIGRARALKWMMTGDDLPAETAAEWGLITDVVDDDRLQDEAAALAQRLAQGPTRAYGAIKHLVDASIDGELAPQLAREAKAQDDVGNSKDAMEGVMAFVQKRAAKFTGE